MKKVAAANRIVEPYLTPITYLATAALLVELVALRILTRTAIHIPGLERVSVVYRVVSEAGRLAFGASVVLVFALFVTVAINQAATGSVGLASILSLFLVFSALAAMGAIVETATDVVTIAAILAVPGLCMSLRQGRWWTLLSPVLLVAAFTTAAIPTMMNKWAPEIDVPVVGLWHLAEALAIAAGIALLARAVTSVSRRSVVYASAAGAIVLLTLVAEPSTTQTLMLWTVGLAGYFPPALYALSFACVVYAAHRTWVAGDRSVTIGMTFVLAGGIGLYSTIQSAAFLMGIAILSASEIIGIRRPPSVGAALAERQAIATET